MAVYKWIKKYVVLMNEYLEQIRPDVSDVWRTDELYMKFKGNMKYLFAVLDDNLRFRIAQQVADSKNNSDVRPLFRKAIEVTGFKPSVIISDGAPNFHEAHIKEFWTSRQSRVEHLLTRVHLK
jgi:transposase-like protein